MVLNFKAIEIMTVPKRSHYPHMSFNITGSIIQCNYNFGNSLLTAHILSRVSVQLICT